MFKLYFSFLLNKMCPSALTLMHTVRFMLKPYILMILLEDATLVEVEFSIRWLRLYIANFSSTLYSVLRAHSAILLLCAAHIA